MRIGNVEIKNNIFLAPMAGITDKTFRNICRRWGAGMTYSEMISAKGMYYKDKKTGELLDKEEDESPFCVQIFGSEPDIIEQAAYSVATKTEVDIIDINMGCPAPKIVSNGDGSALMKDVEKAVKVANSAVKGAEGIPVSVKIRAGWDKDSINCIELAKRLEDAGISAIAVHPRTRDMFYSGHSDWNLIKEVKRAVSIPVVASGDIFTPDDAKQVLEKTLCDAIMVARGAQGNPFIFRQIKELHEYGKVLYIPTSEDRLNEALNHAKMLCIDKGEVRGIKEARKHLAWYVKGIEDASVLRSNFFTVNKIEDVENIISKYFENR